MDYKKNINVIDGDFFESLDDDNNILYFKGDSLNEAFNIQNHHKILITHNSDVNIDESLYQRFNMSKKYDYWFAQNVNCVHDNLISIPIGLERRRNCRFDKYKILKLCKDNFKRKSSKILYANFSIGTKLCERKQCIESFIDSNYLTNKVQMFTPINSILTEEQYYNYCNDILDHKFVLCPVGNGIDTHRMWETLYLGRIPVVLHNPTNDSFRDMPILILNDWKEFKNHIKDEINGTYEKLTTEYWKNLIMKF